MPLLRGVPLSFLRRRPGDAHRFFGLQEGPAAGLWGPGAPALGRRLSGDAWRGGRWRQRTAGTSVRTRSRGDGVAEPETRVPQADREPPGPQSVGCVGVRERRLQRRFEFQRDGVANGLADLTGEYPCFIAEVGDDFVPCLRQAAQLVDGQPGLRLAQFRTEVKQMPDLGPALARRAGLRARLRWSVF